MTDKSAAAVRELVERWMGKKHPITMQSYVSDLTALISEGYVSKIEHTKVVQQRDELREVLKRFTERMRRYWADTYQEEAPDLSLVIEAEAAIKNTDG